MAGIAQAGRQHGLAAAQRAPRQELPLPRGLAADGMTPHRPDAYRPGPALRQPEAPTLTPAQAAQVVQAAQAHPAPEGAAGGQEAPLADLLQAVEEALQAAQQAAEELAANPPAPGLVEGQPAGQPDRFSDLLQAAKAAIQAAREAAEALAAAQQSEADRQAQLLGAMKDALQAARDALKGLWPEKKKEKSPGEQEREKTVVEKMLEAQEKNLQWQYDNKKKEKKPVVSVSHRIIYTQSRDLAKIAQASSAWAVRGVISGIRGRIYMTKNGAGDKQQLKKVCDSMERAITQARSKIRALQKETLSRAAQKRAVAQAKERQRLEKARKEAQRRRRQREYSRVGLGEVVDTGTMLVEYGDTSYLPIDPADAGIAGLPITGGAGTLSTADLAAVSGQAAAAAATAAPPAGAGAINLSV